MHKQYIADKRAVALVDLGAVENNIHFIKETINPHTEIMAVLKGNAYGHGAVPVAKTVIESGASQIAVATIDEALELREAGITVPILLLDTVCSTAITTAIKYDLMFTVGTMEAVKEISREASFLNKFVKVHVKIDTGLGHGGFTIDDKTVDDIVSMTRHKNILVTGIYSVLSDMNFSEDNYTRDQASQFYQLIMDIEEQGVYIEQKHLSSGGGVIGYREFDLDLVRVGSLIYGIAPSTGLVDIELAGQVQPVMTLKSIINHIRVIKEGDSIGYSRTFTADSERTIASIPFGFGDGLSQAFSNKGEVLIGGKRAPIVGQVAMDYTLVDITDIEAEVGDEVVIIGRQGTEIIYAKDMADEIGVHSAQIYTGLTSRVRRDYYTSTIPEEK